MGDVGRDPEIQEEFHAVLEAIKSENIKIEPEIEFLHPYDTEVKILLDQNRLRKILPKADPEERTSMAKEAKNGGENLEETIENFNVNRSKTPKTYKGPKTKETPKKLLKTMPKVAEEESLSSLCRLCATQSNNMVPIFGEDKMYKNIIEKIEHCLSVVVKRTDTLPKQACRTCLEKLEFCHKFHETVAEAEKQLTKLDDKKSGKLVRKEDRQPLPVCKSRRDPVILTANSKGIRSSRNNLDSQLKRKRNSDEGIIASPEKIANTKTTDIVQVSAEDRNFLSNLKLDWDELIPVQTNVNILDKEALGLWYKDQSADLTKDVLNSSQIKLGSCFSLQKSPVQLKEMLKSSEKMCDYKVYPSPIIRTYRARHKPRRALRVEEGWDDILICEEKSEGQTFAIKCKFCGVALQTPKKCYIHESVHVSTNYYPCSICDESFESERKWTEHRSVHTEGEETHKRRTVMISSCNESEKKFLAELRIKFQTLCQKSESKRERVCERKTKTVDPQISLYRHIMTAHREHKESCCKICGIYYRNREQLEAHQRQHERPFQCGLCHRRFSTNYQLENHLQSHCGLRSWNRIKLEDNKYTCEICGRGFDRKSSMSTHIRNHTGDCPYKCTICEKAFTRPDGLKRHALIHSADRRYNCSECTQSFTTYLARKSHMIIHKIEKPHRCKLCGDHFWLLDGTERHKETQHQQNQ